HQPSGANKMLSTARPEESSLKRADLGIGTNPALVKDIHDKLAQGNQADGDDPGRDARRDLLALGGAPHGSGRSATGPTFETQHFTPPSLGRPRPIPFPWAQGDREGTSF